jgi:CRISPR/Cas system-associated exonuclease Cas4 (RecB family)
MDNLDRIVNFNQDCLKDKVIHGLPTVFSYTLLGNFAECPENFFCRNILKLKEPDSLAKIMGVIAHRILQKIHEKNITNPRKAGEIINQVWLESEFRSRFESRNLFPIISNLIFEYFKCLKPGIEVLSSEETFRFNFDGIEFRGRFDRIDRLPGNRERVVDYKTSKNIPGRIGLLNGVERGDNFQIPIYKWARGSSCFTIYRLREIPDKMEVTIDFNDEKAIKALHKAEDMVKQTVDEIRQGIFKPRPNNRCRQCYFERICTT